MKITPDLTRVGIFPSKEDMAAAGRLLVDIVAAKGGRFAGKVLLYKAFYLAHLFYWRTNNGTLSDYPIVRMPNGPGLDRGDDVLRSLVEQGDIEIEQDRNGPYPEYVFTLRKPVRIDPSDPRHKAIMDAIEWLGDKTAAEVSRLIHEYSRTWRTGKDGSDLSIYLDLLTDEEYEQVRRMTAETTEAVDAVFGA